MVPLSCMLHAHKPFLHGAERGGILRFYHADGLHHEHMFAGLAVHVLAIAWVSQMHPIGLLEQGVQAVHQTCGLFLFAILMKDNGSQGTFFPVRLACILLEHTDHALDVSFFLGCQHLPIVGQSNGIKRVQMPVQESLLILFVCGSHVLCHFLE